MPPTLDELIPELRAAVLAADHARADRLACDYAEAVRQLWETLPEPERAASPLPRATRELLTWARGMTIVHRAIAGEQFAVVQKLTRYKSPPSQDAARSAIQVRA